VKRVSTFTLEDEALNRKLVALESNAVAATDELKRDKVTAFEKVFVTKTGARVRAGQCVVVDSTSAVELLLLEPTAGDETKELLVVKRKAAGTVRLRPIATTINSAASVLLHGVGVYVVAVALGAFWMRELLPAAPRPLDTTYSPVALYQFSNGAATGLNDVSGVANAHLSVSAGTARYAWLHPQMQGFLFDGATELIHNAFNATIALAGDMSAIWTGAIQSFPAAGTPGLFAHGTPGGTSAVNILYSLWQSNAAATDPPALHYQHEQGAGVPETHQAGTAWTFPCVITQFGFSRIGNVIRFYNQGYPWGSASAALNAPTGGGSGRLRVGAWGGGSFFSGIVSDLALYSRGLAAAEFLERFNSTLGPAFGRKA
jgi:hypothetical protein